MKPEQIEALESYITTKSHHWNKFAVEVLCETLRGGLFENPEQPLLLISFGEDLFVKEPDKPLKAVRFFISQLEKNSLDTGQKLFIVSCLIKYLKETTYKDISLWDVEALLMVEKKRFTKELNKDLAPVKSIRENLQDAVQSEISALQSTLNGLEPEMRLNMLCKLLRYVRADDKVSH